MIQFAVIHALNVGHVHAQVLLMMIARVLLALSTENAVTQPAVIHALDIRLCSTLLRSQSQQA